MWFGFGFCSAYQNVHKLRTTELDTYFSNVSSLMRVISNSDMAFPALKLRSTVRNS